MIQVSDFIAMFAPSSPKDIILIFKRRAFLCPIGSIVSKDIRLSIPIREYPFFIDCILVLWRDIGRRQPFLYLYISITFSFMPKNSVICNAGNNSTRTATSAHETCTSLTSFFKAHNFVKSKLLRMFAAFTARTSVLIYERRAFLCPIGSVVSKDIRLSIPIREYPFFIDCILVLAGTGRRQPSLYLNISNTFSLMARTDVICNAVNNSTRTATSAHETGIRFFILSLDSNTLRYYTPFGKRRRKLSDSATMRQALCNAMLSEYPGIRRIKIKDCGIRFYSRVWMHSGRVIHHKAYSLRNLAGILCEKVENQEIILS